MSIWNQHTLQCIHKNILWERLAWYLWLFLDFTCKHFYFLQENVRGCGRRKDFSLWFDSAVWFEPISHHSFPFSKIISVIPTNLKRSSRLRLFPKWEVGREAGNEHSVSIVMHLDLFHLENFLRSRCTQLLHHRQFPQRIIGEHVLILCLCIISSEEFSPSSSSSLTPI